MGILDFCCCIVPFTLVKREVYDKSKSSNHGLKLEPSSDNKCGALNRGEHDCGAWGDYYSSFYARQKPQNVSWLRLAKYSARVRGHPHMTPAVPHLRGGGYPKSRQEKGRMHYSVRDKHSFKFLLEVGQVSLPI